MDISNMSIVEKRIERDRYTNLILDSLNKSGYDTNLYNRVKSIILFTVIYSGLLFWLALPTDQSNISINVYNILAKLNLSINIQSLIFIILNILYIILFFSLVYTIKNIKKQTIDVEFLLIESNQNEIFKKFVKEQIKLKGICKSDKKEDIIEELKNKNIPDLKFSIYELNQFIEKILFNKKINYKAAFYIYYPKLILLNQSIEGVLISENELEYTLIINDNFYII